LFSDKPFNCVPDNELLVEGLLMVEGDVLIVGATPETVPAAGV
jgi:hypothetical protein